MPDLLPTLAERLAGVLAPYLVRCEPATGSREDHARFVARAVAREALTFVAKRLPANVLTSEDHAAIQLVIHDQADNRPSSISLTGTLLGIVDRLDALLHDLRGRLGGKS
mgnify:CR=1 FL=1